MTTKKLSSFYIIWIGQLVSLFGTAMTRFAVIVWAYQQTNTVMTLGWLGFFGYVPYIITSPIAGVLIDRMDRRKILIITDGLAGFITIFMLIQFLTGNLAIWHLFLAEGLTSVLEAFQIPAFNASITLLVNKKNYTRANSLFSIANDAAKIFAPIIGGLLLSISNLSTIFTVDIITFLIAMLTLMVIRIPQLESKQIGRLSISGWWIENSEAARFIKDRKGLLAILLVYLNINFFAALTYFCILPALILARTGGDQFALGTVQGFLGIGGLIGGVILAIWGGPKRKVYGFLFATGASFLFGDFLFATGQNIVVWSIGAFISTIFIPLINSNSLAIWQLKVPPEMQGRVFALRSMGQTAVMPIGFLLGGWLADNVFEPLFMQPNSFVNWFSPIVGRGPGAGMGFMFLITCLFGFLTAVVGFSSSSVRNIESDLPDFDFGGPIVNSVSPD